MFNDNCCNNLKSGDDLAGLLGDTPLSRDSVSSHSINGIGVLIYDTNSIRRLVKIFIEEATDKVYLKFGGTATPNLNNTSFPVFKNNLITISNSQAALRLWAFCEPTHSATLKVSVATYDPNGELL